MLCQICRMAGETLYFYMSTVSMEAKVSGVSLEKPGFYSAVQLFPIYFFVDNIHLLSLSGLHLRLRYLKAGVSFCLLANAPVFTRKRGVDGVRIVIIDDHPIVQQGLERCLSMEEDMEVVGIASSCPEGVELISEQKPDLAIVDMRMPDGGGLELIRQAKKFLPGCRFLILTSYSSQGEVAEAVSVNVDGYILKDALPEELLNAIRIIARGRRYYDPEIMDSIINREEKDPLDILTGRELEILHALAEGMNNRDMAKEFYISENTVKKHVCNILGKLEFHDRTQAALFAFSRGLGRAQDNS